MTREQERAQSAYQDVKRIADAKDEAASKRFATCVYQLEAMLQRGGLVQALEFMKALTNNEKREAAELLLDGLGRQMGRVSPNIRDANSLCQAARRAELTDYLLLARELMASLLWYERFVQSLLKTRRGDVADREG